MEDSTDDKKEAKTLNFHQMELDDRILKVNLEENENFDYQMLNICFHFCRPLQSWVGYRQR
jgi:hypothetical protein